MTPETCTSVRCLRAVGDPKRCRCAYLDALVDGRIRRLHRVSHDEIVATAW